MPRSPAGGYGVSRNGSGAAGVANRNGPEGSMPPAPNVECTLTMRTGGRGVANVALSGSPNERNPRNAGLNVWEKRPALHRSARGISRQLPDLGGDSGAAGRGVHASGRTIALIEWMEALADRLRCVRVC